MSIMIGVAHPAYKLTCCRCVLRARTRSVKVVRALAALPRSQARPRQTEALVG